MKKEVIIRTTVIKDEYSGQYTVVDGTPNRKGGAIVSDCDPFVAMEKFKDATDLEMAVMTLNGFAKGERIFYEAKFV